MHEGTAGPVVPCTSPRQTQGLLAGTAGSSLAFTFSAHLKALPVAFSLLEGLTRFLFIDWFFSTDTSIIMKLNGPKWKHFRHWRERNFFWVERIFLVITLLLKHFSRNISYKNPSSGAGTKEDTHAGRQVDSASNIHFCVPQKKSYTVEKRVGGENLQATGESP